MMSTAEQIVPFPVDSLLADDEGRMPSTLTPLLLYVRDEDLRRWYDAAGVTTRANPDQRERFNAWMVESLNRAVDAEVGRP